LVPLNLLLIVLLGIVDYLTGPDLAFSIFYLLPITLVAWLVGRWAGIGVSVAAAGSWLVADLLTGPGYSYPTVPYWNVVVLLGFFLIVTLALAALHDAQKRQEELARFLVHDLRSPLTNVVAALQTLQVVAAKGDTATIEELIEMCMVSCRRMVTLTNSILDLGRLEEGKMPLRLEPLDLRKVIESALEQVAAWARQDAITLVVQLDPDAGTVHADAEVTMRVLVNLLSNAIKVSKAQYQVTVAAAPSGPKLTTISVIDEGPGIPEEWSEKVFEKYGQVEARKGGAALGTGLGLTFCRLAVEAQGGRIWLSRRAQKGTTVTFTLPTDTREEAGRQARRTPLV
jgi:signal transduction histidine kinase